ncbi:unnamed protein product [Gadus morhua 'NCC']
MHRVSLTSQGVSPGLRDPSEQGRPRAAISVPLVSDAPPTPLSVAHAKAPRASLLFWGVLSVSLVSRPGLVLHVLHNLKVSGRAGTSRVEAH